MRIRNYSVCSCSLSSIVSGGIIRLGRSMNIDGLIVYSAFNDGYSAGHCVRIKSREKGKKRQGFSFLDLSVKK